MSGECLVTGKIVFDQMSKPFKNATAYVKLEDVSKQDVSSVIIADQVIRNVGISKEDLLIAKFPELEFALRTGICDDRNMYIISVHVDVDGDGRISLGDYITKEYYPVVPSANPSSIEVHVKEV